MTSPTTTWCAPRRTPAACPTASSTSAISPGLAGRRLAVAASSVLRHGAANRWPRCRSSRVQRAVRPLSPAEVEGPGRSWCSAARSSSSAATTEPASTPKTNTPPGHSTSNGGSSNGPRLSPTEVMTAVIRDALGVAYPSARPGCRGVTAAEPGPAGPSHAPRPVARVDAMDSGTWARPGVWGGESGRRSVRRRGAAAVFTTFSRPGWPLGDMAVSPATISTSTSQPATQWPLTAPWRA